MKHRLAFVSAAVVCAFVFADAACAGETLHNGIVLPDKWPPEASWEDIQAGKPLTEPPYLKDPPAVIPIDVGRQLFVDEFLIESTTLRQDAHLADEYPANPLVRGMPGSVWWDPSYKAFRLWHSGYGDHHKLSTDGVHFAQAPQGIQKPAANDKGGPSLGPPWLNLDAKDPSKRFVSIFPICFRPAGRCQYWVRFCPDGLSWSDAIETDSDCGDASKFFYNPFRDVWVFTSRHGWGKPRARRYWEVRDLEKGPYKEAGKKGIAMPMWVGADSLDPPRQDCQIPCQLYNADAVAYESLIVGSFVIWRGDPPGRSKFKDVCIGFSRDGWHWSRPDRRPHAPISEQVGTWNYVNVDSVTGVAYAVMGDRLFFYVSGRGMLPHLAMYTLRRDGWISMDAGPEGGELITRPVKFGGKHFFVNLDAAEGELRVEALDEKGAPLPPFTKANCRPVNVNKTLQAVTWDGAEDLAALSGRPVRFRFSLKNGKLYSFWVSPDRSGASYGYVGVGGPGYTGSRDTVGIAAYEAVTPAPPPGEAPAPMLWPLSATRNGKAEISVLSPLCTAAPGAMVRCTTDGTDPTKASPLYEKPIVVKADAVIKARTFTAGLNPSAVVSQEYKVTPDKTPPLRYEAAPYDVLAEGVSAVTARLRTNEKAQCRYADKPAVPFDRMTGAMTTEDGFLHKIEVKELKTGTLYSFFVKAQDEFGNADADDHDITFYVPAPLDGAPRYKVTGVDLESAVRTLVHDGEWTPWKLELEAESAELTAPMAVVEEATAAGGKCLASPEQEKGAATFRFTAPAPGAYVAWLRAKGAKGDMQDSFFASMDGGREDVANVPGAAESFRWASLDGRDCRGDETLHPRLFILAKGDHALTIRCRKAGVRLDSLVISNDRLLTKKD